MMNMAVTSVVLVSWVGLGGTGGGSDSGSDGNDDGSQQQQQQQQQPQQQSSPSPSPSSVAGKSDQRAVYFARLDSLNGSDVTGHVGVVVDGNSVGFSLQAFGLDPELMHSQYLRSSTSCSSESNNSEKSNISGFALSLNGAFPEPSQDGVLTYIQSFSEGSVIAAVSSGGTGSVDLGGDVIEIFSSTFQPLACGKLYRSPE
jgi:hypothetical protein